MRDALALPISAAVVAGFMALHILISGGSSKNRRPLISEQQRRRAIICAGCKNVSCSCEREQNSPLRLRKTKNWTLI